MTKNFTENALNSKNSKSSAKKQMHMQLYSECFVSQLCWNCLFTFCSRVSTAM